MDIYSHYSAACVCTCMHDIFSHIFCALYFILLSFSLLILCCAVLAYSFTLSVADRQTGRYTHTHSAGANDCFTLFQLNACTHDLNVRYKCKVCSQRAQCVYCSLVCTVIPDIGFREVQFTFQCSIGFSNTFNANDCDGSIR